MSTDMRRSRAEMSEIWKTMQSYSSILSYTKHRTGITITYPKLEESGLVIENKVG
jgi:hypothetical protein